MERAEVRDIYLASEFGCRSSLAELPTCCREILRDGNLSVDEDPLLSILALPEQARELMARVLSKFYRTNEVYDYLSSCTRWAFRIMASRNITIGSIGGYEHIRHNGRHRLADLAQQEPSPLGADRPLHIMPTHVLIGVHDETPIEDDDVQHNIRLIDGAHRALTLARAGRTYFSVCVGYL